MTPQPPPPPQPPSCSECTTTTQAQGAAASQQSASRIIKASDGKTRIDTGNMSIITDPKTQQAVVLDHLKQTAQILPMKPSLPQLPGMPQVPGMPQAPGMQPPQAPQVSMQDLGKSVIEGHPVDGKRYIAMLPPPPQPPKPPQMPQPPQLPGMPPGMPQAPQAPQPPQAPQLPPAPTVTDVWSSTKLGTPVLTKVSGPFGQQITYCKPQETGEPHPALFQIPAGYKPILPPAPTPPSPPTPPSLPK